MKVFVLFMWILTSSGDSGETRMELKKGFASETKVECEALASGLRGKVKNESTDFKVFHYCHETNQAFYKRFNSLY